VGGQQRAESPPQSLIALLVITTVLPNGTEDMRWSVFQRVDELNSNFLLFYAPNSYYVLPKRRSGGSMDCAQAQ